MWIRINEIFAYCTLLLLFRTSLVKCHLPDKPFTTLNKIEQYCQLAETTPHDTIPICGKSGDDTRTFLDICDLYEFVCDTNKIYNHIDDIVGCPKTEEN